MTFSLKNVGATYKCLVNYMFQDLSRKSMKVYIEDLIVKSKEKANHLKHLAEAFSILRKFQMKLNPAKCASGVSSEKFLGYFVSRR